MTINPEDFGAVTSTVKIDPAQFGAMANIDKERGAPIAVRTSVGASKKPQDKLASLKSFYPDAEPWGKDNFVFTDPETKSRTLYNPKGLDMGDVSESARMIFEFVGGSIGGAGAVVAGQLGPQVATPEEAVTVPLAVGAGAALGGQAYDLMANLFYPTADSRTFLETAAGATTDVMANAIGHKMGEVLEKTVKAGVSKGAYLARSTSDEIYKAFSNMGVKPSAGAISGSRVIQGFENALSKLPASADIIGKEYTKQLDEIGKYAEDLARNVSPIDGREAVGTAVRKGVDDFVSKFKVSASELYKNVDELIPSNTRVQVTNLGSSINSLVGDKIKDPEVVKMLGTSLINQLKAVHRESTKQILDPITMTNKNKGVAYSSLKAIRTKIGGLLNKGQLIGDTTQGELKQIYEALSDDMILAASKRGKDALFAANRASKFWSAGRARIDDILTPVVNKKINQDIFAAAMSGSKNGSQTLRALKKSIPADEWDAVVAQQVREMGMATPGKQNKVGDLFSPGTFATNFVNLNKASKKILFDGPQYRGLSEAMDNLITVSSALKDTAQMANTSGTAQQMMYMQLLGGGLGGFYGSHSGDGATSGAMQGMGVAASVQLIPWAAAKLITSPKFINWLAQSGEIAATKSGIGAHLGQLSAIALKDKTLAPAIEEYMKTVKTIGGQYEQ